MTRSVFRKYCHLKSDKAFHRVDQIECQYVAICPDQYVVRVDWIRSFPLTEAKWSQSLFANQNIVRKLRDPKTLEFLKHHFAISDTQ